MQGQKSGQGMEEGWKGQLIGSQALVGFDKLPKSVESSAV